MNGGRRLLQTFAGRQDEPLGRPRIPDALDASLYSRVATDVGSLWVASDDTVIRPSSCFQPTSRRRRQNRACRWGGGRP